MSYRSQLGLVRVSGVLSVCRASENFRVVYNEVHFLQLSVRSSALAGEKGLQKH